MEIYLPVAEVSVDLLMLLALGSFVGFLSGVFGVGGGFLLTPFLIFVGIPPAIAVATSANQLVGTSVSGVIGHWRRGNVDFKMGGVLLIGGIIGSLLGVWLFGILRRIGQIELVINLSYILLLGTLGGLMLIEGTRVAMRGRKPGARRKLHQHTWVHGLPLKMRFRRSKLYISGLLPLGLGFIIGILSAIMGVGGGFIMVPAMIYLLGVPTKVVVGTSLFQIIFVTGFTTLMHATTSHTVDLGLALVLVLGGVIGAQIGTRIGLKLKAEQLRILLALLVLAVCGNLALDLLLKPSDLYSVGVAGAG
jgi:uncharacterized membrane protein YfcA